MPTLTTAPFSRRFTICHSAASETPEWANIMVNGDSAHTQTRAESCRTARRSTSVACATRPTTTTESCAKLSCRHNQVEFFADPVAAQISKHENGADLFLARLTVAF